MSGDLARHVRDNILPYADTVTDAAREAGTSTRYLRAIFEHAGLKSPSNYLPRRVTDREEKQPASTAARPIVPDREDPQAAFEAWAAMVCEPRWQDELRRGVQWIAADRGHIPAAAMVARCNSLGAELADACSLRLACSDLGEKSPW
jgi:hypothetical protein